MHTTFAIESNDSRAPGILPEPVRVHDQPVSPMRRPRRPPPGRATKPLGSPGQGNPVSIVLAKLMGVIRGDTYTVDAYPSASRSDSAPRDGGGLIGPNHDGPLRAGARSPAPPDPGEAEHSVLAGSRTNKH